MLSIVIPTYNRSMEIQRLTKQLLAQSRPPDEIIIVDDHSTDNTRETVQQLYERHPTILYVQNRGRYQRDAKQTGVGIARGEYIGFLDDDVLINDRSCIEKLCSHLDAHSVIQTKVVLENMGRTEQTASYRSDRFTTRPYPILELLPTQYNTGSKPRAIFPLIEFGCFFPRMLSSYFTDRNVILDGYGESFSWSLKLWRAGIPIRFVPDVVIRHPGSSSGGSSRFNKTTLVRDFTQFHEGYFYNMIYLHARYYPWWIGFWLPFYVGKACIALALNQNGSGFIRYALAPIMRSLEINFFARSYAP